MDAATLLRTARSRAGLTLRQLAERADTSHSRLAAYEAGRTVPGVDTLDRILRAAGYHPVIALSSVPDATREERVAKGEELLAALELAAMFPARHSERTSFPPLRVRTMAQVG